MMWQRFTERARKVIFYAQEEAQRLGESQVSTEHLLLGLVRDPDSVAARVLDRLEVRLERIKREVEQIVPRGDAKPGQEMQLTPRAKRVIDLAYDESRQLNNNYIGTEHLLLGLIREGEGLAARILTKLGIDLDRARIVVRQLQDQKPQREPQARPQQPTPTPVEETAALEAEIEANLLKAAGLARANAYAPYSKYRVGAAVLSADDAIYSGCNVENASYGLSVCAERVAIWNAVVAGVREIKAVAVTTKDRGTPCGACLQVMAEFVKDPQQGVILVSDDKGKKVERYRLSDLLPKPFGL